MPAKQDEIEAISVGEGNSILIPATIFKPLEGNMLHRVAFGGFGNIGSASFAAFALAKEKNA